MSKSLSAAAGFVRVRWVEVDDGYEESTEGLSTERKRSEESAGAEEAEETEAEDVLVVADVVDDNVEEVLSTRLAST